MKKNILILNWRCPRNPSSGGAESVTLRYAQALVAAGYKVTWLSGGFRGAKKKELIEGVRIVRVGSPLSVYFLAPYIYWFTYKGKFSIVIDEIHGIPFLTPLWAWKSKKLAFIHEVAKEIWDEMLPFPLNWVGKLYENIYFGFYRKTHFLVDCDSTKKDLIAHSISSDLIRVIQPGFNQIPLDTPLQKEKDLTLLSVSRLVKMKNVEDAVKATYLLKAKYPNIKLWIVGDGDKTYKTHLENIIKKLNIQKNVIFYGYISEAEKERMYQQCHFLIHTSIREGYGLVVLEANSQGTPAAVYDSPALRDIVVENVNGFIASKKDLFSLTEKIHRAFSNKEKYKQIAQDSISYSKQFTWKKAGNEMVNYISSKLK